MSKFVFYLLSFTWGFVMTFIGLITALILIFAGYKPESYGYCLHFKMGNNWGGISLGFVFITDQTPSEHTKMHEHGHSIQNCYWGILFPFVIAIPSVIRYWYREYLVRSKKKKWSELPDYDSMWFEGDATKRGTKLIESLGAK